MIYNITSRQDDPTKMTTYIFRAKGALHLSSVGTWNVRTIMNDYTLYLVYELSKFRCDIVGIA